MTEILNLGSSKMPTNQSLWNVLAVFWDTTVTFNLHTSLGHETMKRHTHTFIQAIYLKEVHHIVL